MEKSYLVYSEHDTELAVAVKKLLEDMGLTFCEPVPVERYNEDTTMFIRGIINAAPCVVVVISQDTQSKRPLLYRMKLAHDFKRPIMAVRKGEFALCEGFCDLIRNAPVFTFSDADMDENLGLYEKMASYLRDIGAIGDGNKSVGTAGGDDPIIRMAAKIAIESGHMSVSGLQRKFSIGYARAALIMDKMEELGFIGPATGSSAPRKVLITPQKYKEIYGEDITAGKNAENDAHRENKERLEAVLTNILKGPVRISGQTVGNLFTRYEIDLPQGVTAEDVARKANYIEYELVDMSPLRIIPSARDGNTVAIEASNRIRAVVRFGELIASEEYCSAGGTNALIGQGIDDKAVLCDLEKIPHLLIGGQTGCGKTNLFNSIIFSLMDRHTPDNVRFIFAASESGPDSFSGYLDSPYMYFNRVFKTPDEIVGVLCYAVKEMERRYAMLAESKVRNVTEYNIKHEDAPLPHIVMMLDRFECAMTSERKASVEDKIKILAGKARGAGIHVIVAFMRCTTDVITGTIRTNFTSRIAMRVSDALSSRILIDDAGAEKLVGHGDMLYYPACLNEPIRVQAAFVDAGDIAFYINRAKARYENAFFEYSEACEEPPSAASKKEDKLTEEKIKNRARKMPGYNAVDETFALSSKISYPDGTEMRFGLILDEKTSDWYVADCGYTIKYARTVCEKERLENRLRHILGKDMVDIFDERIAIRLPDAVAIERCAVRLVRVAARLIKGRGEDLFMPYYTKRAAELIKCCDDRDLVVQSVLQMQMGVISSKVIQMRFGVGYARASKTLEYLINLDLIKHLDGDNYEIKPTFTDELVTYVKNLI